MFEITSTCKNGDGYIYCRTEPPHPNAYSTGLIAEHRVVAENKIGRLLKKGEVVHHIDGNTHNNNPDNLQVMNIADHVRLHSKKESGYIKPLVPVVCNNCGKLFGVEFGDYNGRVKRSGKLYCSHSCSSVDGYNYPSKTRGKNSYGQKLTVEDVKRIRKICADGANRKQVAKEYGINVATVYSIVSKKIWKYVE